MAYSIFILASLVMSLQRLQAQSTNCFLSPCETSCISYYKQPCSPRCVYSICGSEDYVHGFCALPDDSLPCTQCNLIAVECLGMNRSVTSFPSSLSSGPNYAHALSLRNKNYSFVPRAVFASMSIRYLDLSQNLIEEVSSDAFAAVQGLRELMLVDNWLTSVELNGSVADLELLIIDMNRLVVVTRSTFSGLSKLKILNLEQNRIELIAVDAFDNNPILALLNLKSNRLRTIGFRSASLLSILIDMNNSTVISNNSFSGLPSLRAMNLEYNPLSELEIDAQVEFSRPGESRHPELV